MKRMMLMVASMTVLAGCSIFPYDSHFLCEGEADFGKCTSVHGAYKDSLQGTPEPGSEEAQAAASHTASGSKKDKPSKKEREAAQQAALRDREVLNQYRDAEFHAMADMMDAPVAPLVAPPKVLRTLIVAYRGDQTLYMPRYVFTMIAPARFVMGDYLNKPSDDTPSVYPLNSLRDAMEGP